MLSIFKRRRRRRTLSALFKKALMPLFSCLLVALMPTAAFAKTTAFKYESLREHDSSSSGHQNHERVAVAVEPSEVAEEEEKRRRAEQQTEAGSSSFENKDEREGEEESTKEEKEESNQDDVQENDNLVVDIEEGGEDESLFSEETIHTTENQEQSKPSQVWENGILVVNSLKDVEPVLSEQRIMISPSFVAGDGTPSGEMSNEKDTVTQDDDSDATGSGRATSSSLMLALIYSTLEEKCADLCATMVERVEEANRLMQHHWETTRDNLVTASPHPPVFAKFSTEGASTSSSPDSTTTENGEEKNDEMTTPNLAELLGIDFVPQLVLLVLDANDNLFLLQYAGRLETAEDIFKTYLHYYYRLALATGAVQHPADADSEAASSSPGAAEPGVGIKVLPKSFENQSQVQSFISDHREGLLQHSFVPQGLSPSISPSNKVYIEWLLEPDTRTDKADDFVLFVQCRSSPTRDDGNMQLYDAFDKMNSLMTNRRDRLFVTISECHQNAMDGSVVAWKIPVDLNEPWEDNDHYRHGIRLALFVPDCDAIKEDNDKNSSKGDGNSEDRHDDKTQNRFVEFVIRHATPSTLWFDRQATAPIAFPLSRKVHAVLFVDLHHVPPLRAAASGDSSDVIDSRHTLQREVIRRFRQTCQNHRHNDPALAQDTVCLIVPSTEVRVLNTFGIDLWTPMDEQVMRIQDLLEEEESDDASFAALEEVQVLPTLLITDRRTSGTKRYYLERSAMDAAEGNDYGLDKFLSDFWADRLPSALKTSSRGARTNEVGVRIVTAETFSSEVLENDRHALILFKSPTCGHCKRFSVIWNQLAEFIAHVQWDSFLTLYQMDVSTDEVLDVKNLTVRWVPDIAYISPNNRERAERYTQRDELGDGVGGLDNHMQVMEWLLQVGDFEEKELKTLLTDLRRNF